MGDVDNTAMKSPCLNLNIDKLLMAEGDATVKVQRSRTWDGTRKVFGTWYSQSHGEARPFFFSLVSPLFMAGVTARPAMRPIICSPQGTHHAGLLRGGCERDLCTRWITLSLCKLGDLERSSRGNRWGSEFACVCVCRVCLSVCLCVREHTTHAFTLFLAWWYCGWWPTHWNPPQCNNTHTHTESLQDPPLPLILSFASCYMTNLSWNVMMCVCLLHDTHSSGPRKNVAYVRDFCHFLPRQCEKIQNSLKSSGFWWNKSPPTLLFLAWSWMYSTCTRKDSPSWLMQMKNSRLHMECDGLL